MTLLERYVGQFVTAQSASDYIDINTIISECNELETNAKEFNLIFEKMETIALETGNDTLCFGNKSIKTLVDANIQVFGDSSNDIKEVASNIRNAAENAYNEIQRQLNEIARSQDLVAINGTDK